MDSKECIIPFVNCESETPVDLKQLYLKENDIFEDERVCRLCMQIITCSFTSVEEVDVDLLRKFVPEIKFSGKSKEAMCNDCRRKLNAAVEFKSACLNTDKMIIPHLDCKKMLQLDLAEVYMKENGNGHLRGISYQPKICRLCMQLINDEIRCIGEEELEAIHKFVPEMNISIIIDPVVCRPCYDSVCTHNAFLNACLEEEHKIADIFEGSATESLTDATASCLIIKTENLDNESEANKEKMPIKIEYVDIKSEENGERSDILSPFNSETIDSSDRKDEEVGHQYMYRLYKCDKCVYETESKSHFMSHYAKHSSILKGYKCEICEYVTNRKTSLKSHILKHKDPSEIQMYRCNDCDFTAKYKNGIVYHVLRHKDPSQVQMYKCDACDYQSRHKKSFTRHQLIHKDAAEVEMYRCNECSFKSKYRNSLTNHLLLHRDPLQVKMYKCDSCDYESRRKKSVTSHRLTHKDPSQVRMYKCDSCDYESRYKESFIKHQVTHKDPSEAQMYRCNDCYYETKYKRSLACHVLLHKAPSQVRMYKCGTCNFETRYKGNLKGHELSHKMQ